MSKKSTRPEPKYVYLLASVSYGHNGFFKIGVTANFKDRYSQIKNNTPFNIIKVVVVSDKNPLNLESNFLDEFKPNRIKGEWFYVSPSLDIDCSKCTFREFMNDFESQSRELESKMKDFLIISSTGGVVDALL